ncbi:Protein trachealess [Eumeta japonica]|uniref:Protein trachealess n=1 Tax=Eumeta variegata TaxID=151549 RepID=A0A4C1U6V8_EUMVA|nr:Protein trachealess [Eumeta japonica]
MPQREVRSARKIEATIKVNKLKKKKPPTHRRLTVAQHVTPLTDQSNSHNRSDTRPPDEQFDRCRRSRNSVTAGSNKNLFSENGAKSGQSPAVHQRCWYKVVELLSERLHEAACNLGPFALQSLDGFALSVAADGRFLYISETVSIYLGLSQYPHSSTTRFRLKLAGGRAHFHGGGAANGRARAGRGRGDRI